jgi:hypothetical protein
MKNITVIIDRVSGSNIPTAKAEIEEVLEALKPLRERGLRVRVCRSHLTLKEDKPWRAKAAGVAVVALALVMLAAVAAPASAQNQRTFYNDKGQATGTATTSGNTSTSATIVARPSALPRERVTAPPPSVTVLARPPAGGTKK